MEMIYNFGLTWMVRFDTKELQNRVRTDIVQVDRKLTQYSNSTTASDRHNSSSTQLKNAYEHSIERY
jgi:hypothetical protein